MQQQAAAHRDLSWVSGLCQGKGVRTDVDVYTQGQQVSDCLKQRPQATTKGQSAMCSWFLCASLLVVQASCHAVLAPSAAMVGS